MTYLGRVIVEEASGWSIAYGEARDGGGDFRTKALLVGQGGSGELFDTPEAARSKAAKCARPE